MKNAILILLCSGLFLSARSQYVVTKVTGQVKLKPSGTLLVPGMKLADLDHIEFSSNDDNVRIMAAGKGIYSLVKSPDTAGKLDAIADLIKVTLKIKARTGTLSGRGNANEKVPEVFENEPTVNNRTLINPETKFVFEQKKYPVAEGGRFFLQIEMPGVRAMAKPLRTSADTLFLGTADFAAGATDGTSYTLGFYNKTAGSSTSVTPLYPYLDTAQETRGIILAIREALPEAGIDSVRVTAYREVYTALGKPSLLTFNEIFKAAIKK